MKEQEKESKTEKEDHVDKGSIDNVVTKTLQAKVGITSSSTTTSSTTSANESARPLRFSGRYGVFALGSSAYPNFCAYGKYLDTVLAEVSYLFAKTNTC